MASIDLLTNDPNAKPVVAGDTIFTEGDAGEHAFVVIEGEVELSVHGKPMEMVRSGGIFGEMALIDDNPRAGTAVAVTETSLLCLDEKQFTRLVRESPDFAIILLRTVVKRVRQADRFGRQIATEK